MFLKNIFFAENEQDFMKFVKYGDTDRTQDSTGIDFNDLSKQDQEALNSPSTLLISIDEPD